jgi:hypothetical protein
LRTQRHPLFDDAFQQELESMYRATGEGKVPVAPALLAMVVVLQAYTGASDAEADEHAILDARWQLVLDTSGRKKPAFSRGTLQAFRDRLVAHDMDRRLLARTIEVARQTASGTRRLKLKSGDAMTVLEGVLDGIERTHPKVAPPYRTPGVRDSDVEPAVHARSVLRRKRATGSTDLMIGRTFTAG